MRGGIVKQQLSLPHEWAGLLFNGSASYWRVQLQVRVGSGFAQIKGNFSTPNREWERERSHLLLLCSRCAIQCGDGWRSKTTAISLSGMRQPTVKWFRFVLSCYCQSEVSHKSNEISHCLKESERGREAYFSILGSGSAMRSGPSGVALQNNS